MLILKNQCGAKVIELIDFLHGNNLTEINNLDRSWIDPPSRSRLYCQDWHNGLSRLTQGIVRIYISFVKIDISFVKIGIGIVKIDIMFNLTKIINSSTRSNYCSYCYNNMDRSYIINIPVHYIYKTDNILSMSCW